MKKENNVQTMNRPKRAEARGDRMLRGFFCFFVLFFAAVCLYPVLLAVGTSFTSEVSVTQHGFNVIPKEFSLDAYKTVFGSMKKNLFNAYKITIFVAVFGTLFSLFVSSTFAYVLTMREFRARNVLNLFLYIPMIFSAGLLPWYIMCTKYYGLSDKFYALILPCALNAFNVFLLRNFFKSIPEELKEAAQMDGAGYLRIYSLIYMPLAKVGLVTVGLFYALSYWNDYYLALMFINKQDLYPLQYYLYNMLANVQFMSSQAGQSLGYTVNIPLETARMATICVTIGPIVLLYPMVQKYFAKGVIVGAVKG